LFDFGFDEVVLANLVLTRIVFEQIWIDILANNKYKIIFVFSKNGMNNVW